MSGTDVGTAGDLHSRGYSTGTWYGCQVSTTLPAARRPPVLDLGCSATATGYMPLLSHFSGTELLYSTAKACALWCVVVLT
eukprot:2352033-Rhodomonas_salina.1